MVWTKDEIFEYSLNTLTKLEVHWNLDDGEIIEITKVKVDDDSIMSGDELWDSDIDLAEDITSYIEDEFLYSEDFWLTKFGYNF